MCIGAIDNSHGNTKAAIELEMSSVNATNIGQFGKKNFLMEETIVGRCVFETIYTHIYLYIYINKKKNRGGRKTSMITRQI